MGICDSEFVLLVAGEVGSGLVYFGLHENFPRVALVGLGKHPNDAKPTPEEEDNQDGAFCLPILTLPGKF